MRFNYLLIAAFLTFAGCSKDNSAPESLSAANDLVTVKIVKDAAAGIQKDALVYKFKDEVYVTVDQGADLSSVSVEFQTSPQASVTVNGQKIAGNSAKLNIEETLLVEVAAENGAKKTFTVFVQDGVSEIDRLIYEYKTRYDIPGVSLALSSSDDHQILYKKGYGFAIKEDKLRAKPNHLYRLGSVSKQFTALAVMKLVDEGLLSVDDRVFGNGGILEQEFSNVSSLATQVTVKHLLSHTSGWISNPDYMFNSPYNRQTLDELIALVLNSTQRAPGAFSYYNMGYGVLGKIVEKLSGKKFEIYLKEVLAEANIDDIHVGKDKAGRRSNEVVYYSQDGYNGYLNNMEMIAGAGGVIASTEEMLKLLPYIDGKTDVPDILSKTVRDQMFTKAAQIGETTFYALGWRGGHRLYPNSFFHSGNLAGTGAMWVIGPDVNAVILLNSRSYQSDFDDEMYYLLEKLITEAKKL